MQTNDMSIRLGGEAGQGVQSTGTGFCQALGRSGLNFFAREDYRSQIRGGQNFFEIRIGTEELFTHKDEADLLIALAPETVEKHLEEVVSGGGIIFEEDEKLAGKIEEEGLKSFPVPLKEIAKEEGGAEVMANTAAIGVACGLTGFDLDYVEEIVEENFSAKGEAVVRNNVKVARAGRRYAREHLADFPYALEAPGAEGKRLVLDGNRAFSLGALASGCNFISAYPMTPSTSIFETLTKYAQEYGVVSKQTESELAAINMALGASHVGARALVSTSGGGFALMAEALSLAGMTETPVVIAEVQRPGPSTGLPTRTEQGDLSFVVNVGHGEFPRLVLTPGTIEEYFQAGARAFNLAERYQTPVIVLADQHLADSLRPIPWEAIDMEDVEIDRGKLLSGEELDQLENYKRHELTEDGISPRALPGHPNAVFDTTGNEHDERGKITEDPEMREKMVEKRAQKLEQAGKEVFPLKRYGPGEAEVTFLGWGSSYGAIREATAELNEDGRSANFYHLPQVWPLPEEELKEVFAGSKRTVMVEGNNESQLAHLIRSRLGEGPDASILKYDGRPLTPDYILSKLSGLNF